MLFFELAANHDLESIFANIYLISRPLFIFQFYWTAMSGRTRHPYQNYLRLNNY